MNIVKRKLLQLFFPEIYDTLGLEMIHNMCAYDQLWVARREYLVVAKEFDAQSIEMDKLCDRSGVVIDILMSLVAINEDGDWATVFDADTVVPKHAQDYLHGLVSNT